MAKLKAPFFSLGAHGTVGQALTVSRYKGLHVAKKVPLHPDAQSAAQLAHRELYSHARDLWLTLTEAEKATLLAEGTPLHMTGFNLLLRRYLTDLLDLEAWWPLNDGGAPTAHDYSLHRTHGAAFGCIAADDFCGQVDNAFYFDGVNDFVRVTAPQLDFTSTDFSLTCRFRQQSYGYHCLYIRGLHNAEGVYCQTHGVHHYVYFVTSQAAAAQSTETAIDSVALNTWYTLGISRVGSVVDIYLQGVNVTDAHGNHIDPLTSARNVKIGIYDDEASSELHGRVCDVKLYSRALTPAQHLATHQRYCVHPPR